MKALSHLIFFTLSMNFYFVCGYGDEEDLLEILRENLTNYSPPPDLFNRTVFIDLELTQFLEVNEILGVISFTIKLTLTYYVPSAAWEPADFNGIDALTLPTGAFWTPDIVILDVVEELFRSSGNQFIQARNGTVTAMSSLVTLKIPCALNMEKFPFDEHLCLFRVGPWREHLSHFQIAFGDHKQARNSKTLVIVGSHKLDMIQHNPEWSIRNNIDLQILEENGKQLVQMRLHLSRQPSYYMILFAFPSSLLMVLNAAVAFIPIQWTEKLSFAVTVFLAQLLIFSTLTELLPASPQNFPAFGIFIVNAIMIMCTTCLASVFAVKIYCYSDTGLEMPLCLQKVVTSKIMYVFGLSKYKPEPKQDQHQQRPRATTIPLETPKKQTYGVMTVYSEKLGSNASSFSPENTTSSTESETSLLELQSCSKQMWMKLAYFTERGIFAIQILHIVIFTVVMISILF